jgi:RNA polymerase sigma-70 factor, ECF subfamily
MQADRGYLLGTRVPLTAREPLGDASTDRNVGAAVAAQSSNPSADTAMDRYAAGDDHAFEELYVALCPRLQRYAVWLVRDRARAEDLVQQTFEKLLLRRGHFQRGSAVTPWAFSILRNQVRDQKKRPRIELLSPDGQEDEGQLSSRPDPQMCAEAKELEARIRVAIDGLCPSQRQAFELVHYGELSHAEAAEVLDATVAGIKSRLQRAHEVLRVTLRPADEQGGS